MSPLTPIRISSIRCSYYMVLALTDTGEALHWAVLSAIFLTFVLFIYHVTTYSHQDLLHPVFVLHGPGPHRHREALHWGVLSVIFLTFVLFIYHVTTYSHQDLLYPVFVLHGPGPHRHRWGPPLGSAQCYISNVCFIHTSCHHLLPSGSPLSGVCTPWSWPSQTPVRPSTGECSVLYF